VIFPSGLGGHNWMLMSFNPHTGLVYIPSQEIGMLYDLEREGFTYKPGRLNLGTNTLDTLTAVPPKAASGHLSAWDPVQRREVWRVPYTKASNGEILTTAGRGPASRRRDRRKAVPAQLCHVSRGWCGERWRVAGSAPFPPGGVRRFPGHRPLGRLGRSGDAPSSATACRRRMWRPPKPSS